MSKYFRQLDPVFFSALLQFFLFTKFDTCDSWGEPERTIDKKSQDCHLISKRELSNTDSDHNYCELFPNSGEGPFYIPNQKVRSNITEGKPGVSVKLTLIVRDVATCKPIPNTPVDIWHSDALGYYSGYLSYYTNGKLRGLDGSHVDPTDDEEFLRGTQYTDSNGTTIFHTIYPGWYSGRTNHYHIMVRTENGKIKFPGHIYFTDETTVAIGKEIPYNQNRNIKIPNERDGPFAHRHGEKTILKFEGTVKDGFEGTMVLGIRQSSRKTKENLR